jgi:hypothetical protein
MARPHIGEMTDDGEYYVAALALAHGQGYTLPSRPDIPTSKYPPGLSLTAAPLVHFFPSYNAARAVVTLFGVLLFLAGFKLLRDWGLGEWEAVLLMIPVMFQPAVLFWPVIMVSDVPFAAIVLAFFCLRSETRKRLVLLGVLAAYGYLLRSNGIILLLAGVVIAKRRTLYLLGGFLLVVVPVKLWLAQGRGETYGDNSAFFTHHSLKQILGLFAGNAWAYFQTFGLWIYPIIETNKFQRVSIIFVIAAVIPLALGLHRFRSWPFALFTLANLALFIVWPWAVGIRAFIWLGPAILFCWYKGWGKYRRYALAVTLLCAVLMTAMTVKRNHHITDPDYDAAIGYIKTSTPPDAVVASYMPESVYLYSGHPGCRTLLDRDFMTDVQGNWAPIEDCAKDRPLYLLVPLGNIFESQGAALVHNATRPAVLEFQNDHFRIYRIDAK